MNEEGITKIVYLSAVISILLHVILGITLVRGAHKEEKRERIISIDVIKEPKKEPPPTKKAEEPPKPAPRPPKTPRVVDLTKTAKIVKTDKIKDETETTSKNPQNPQNFGIDKSLVDDSGRSTVAVAVPIGETMIGNPELKRGDSDLFVKKDGSNANTNTLETITELPKLIKEVKPDYPEEARRLGIEGSVVLLLEIDEKGDVASAKLIKRFGYGLDEEAIKAAYKLKFSPALAGKAPVRAKIKYTFTFILED